MKKVAIIQVKGILKSSERVRKTLKHLGLLRKNSCVVLDPTDSLKGMLLIVMSYVTWGEIDEETMELLLTKRGRVAGNKLINDEYSKKNLDITLKDFARAIINGKNKIRDMPGLKAYFRLTPPIGGLGNGSKKQFSLGGAVGYRKDKINELIKRMI